MAAGAQQQGKLWPFLEAFYAAQGAGELGLRDRRLPALGRQAAGVDADKALAYADGDAAQIALNHANPDAETLGVNATPTFVVQRGNGKAKVVSADKLAAALAQ